MIQFLTDRIADLPGFNKIRAKKAVSILFRICLEHLPSSVSQQIFDAVPGAFAIASSAHLPPFSASGGIETMIEDAIANQLGSTREPLIVLMSAMRGAGFTSEESRAASALFIRFLTENVGVEAARHLTEAVPGLNRLS